MTQLSFLLGGLPDDLRSFLYFPVEKEKTNKVFLLNKYLWWGVTSGFYFILRDQMLGAAVLQWGYQVTSIGF